jgi:hypothetical protein
VSDIDCDELLEANFICLGCSNCKTSDVLASNQNIFVQMSGTGWVLVNGQPLSYTCSSVADHGFILRLTPTDHPGYSWIACVGLGEWGTSGAAWYLANRWQTLATQTHPFAFYSGFRKMPDFLAVVRVQPGFNESASPVAIYRNACGRLKEIK